MKFYGIDMQGKYLVEEKPSPSWTSSDDRRLVRDGNTGRLLIGTNTKLVPILTEDQPLPPGTITELDGLYHPLNGNNSESMTALSYTGDGTDHLRVTDKWIKLSDNTPLTSSEKSGIKVELNTTGSDIDDAIIYFNYVDGEWYLDNARETASIIATEDWTDSKIISTLITGSYLTTTSGDLRYVRAGHMNDGGGSPNDSYNEWYELIADNLGPVTADTVAYPSYPDRQFYRKNEVFNTFVRVGTASGDTLTENVPSVVAGGLWVETRNIATVSSVVMRNASGNIYFNTGYGTATAAQFADLAEKYTCDEGLLVGTIVEVSGDDGYEVVPCMFDLSPSVVGVVSENPAYLMNSGSEGLPVALMGKVPVRVVGEVRKGDFIVASGSGMARKGTPDELCYRIGIVLKTDLHTNEKLVECIIK